MALEQKQPNHGRGHANWALVGRYDRVIWGVVNCRNPGVNSLAARTLSAWSLLPLVQYTGLRDDDRSDRVGGGASGDSNRAGPCGIPNDSL
jgi:hypothetical protein